MERLLWRLESGSAAPHAPHQFQAGLALHLAHSDLLSILVRQGERAQAYLSTMGCEGCGRGRHAPGCYAALLQRLLSATFESAELVLVPHGLARRPYRQVVLAHPSKQSKPVTDVDLTRWPEARLLVHWKQAARGLTTAALLAVGDGPDPASVLRERGWTGRRLPRLLGLRLANAPISRSVWLRRAWAGPPSLLIPPIGKGVVSIE
jgi:hypothetical protein